MIAAKGAPLVVDPLLWACVMTPERADARDEDGYPAAGIIYIAGKGPVVPGCWWRAESPKDC